MSFYEGANWIVTYDKKIKSPGGNILVIEEKRLKFTNVVMSRGTIYQGENIIIELDLRTDVRTFWAQWLRVKNSDPESYEVYNHEARDSREVRDNREAREAREALNTPKPGPTLRSIGSQIVKQPVTSPPMPGGNINYDEYLICKGYRPGAMLVSINEKKIYNINTDYEWRNAIVSPDGKKLAVICDQDSSEPIRVFNFTNPSHPPYPEFTLDHKWHRNMKKYDSSIQWVGTHQLKITVPINERDELSMGFDCYNEDFIVKIRDPVNSSRGLVSQSMNQI